MTLLWIFYVLTLALHHRHLLCYVHTTVQHLFTRQMFSVCTVQRYQLPHVTTVNATICVKWLGFTCVCHFSKQFTTHRPTSHFLQKYIVLHICFCSEHTWHCHCFPLEGQWWECFTSSRLSWDADGLGLPFEMPLAVTLSSCDWIINPRTRTSRKCLWVFLPPHDLCVRNAFRMVMSVTWRNSFLVHFHVLQAVP